MGHCNGLAQHIWRPGACWSRLGAVESPTTTFHASQGGAGSAKSWIVELAMPQLAAHRAIHPGRHLR